MSLFQEIEAARMLLELPERATRAQIKSSYRALVQKWHPDRCREPRRRSEDMTARIIAAYRTLSAYCDNYQFSFSKQEVSHYLPVEEWWLDRFGCSPLWSREPNPHGG